MKRIAKQTKRGPDLSHLTQEGLHIRKEYLKKRKAIAEDRNKIYIAEHGRYLKRASGIIGQVDHFLQGVKIEFSKRKNATRAELRAQLPYKEKVIEGMDLFELTVRRKNLSNRMRVLHNIIEALPKGNDRRQRAIKLTQLITEDLFLATKAKNKLVPPNPPGSKAKKRKVRKGRFAPSDEVRPDGLPAYLIGFKVIQELPFEQLYSHYSEHHRLQVFATKGLKCIHPECDRTASRLIMAEDMSGGIHVDVYTHDLKHMNVDHIIPSSRGGADTLDNKQPMCANHNRIKSNNLVPY